MTSGRHPLRTIALALVLCASMAHWPALAADLNAPDAAIADPATSAALRAATVPANSVHDVRAAVRLLAQAALQRDFASSAMIRTLLQSAHDKLAASEQVLCCLALDGVVQLESDIETMVARVDNVADALQTRDGATMRPPNRDELNLLAKEGQHLLRDPIAQAWSEREDSFAAARNAATLVKIDGDAAAARERRRPWPAAPSSPQASTLLSLNF